MAKKLQLKQENKKHKKEGGHRFLEPTFRNDLLTVAYFLYNTFFSSKRKKVRDEKGRTNGSQTKERSR